MLHVWLHIITDRNKIWEKERRRLTSSLRLWGACEPTRRVTSRAFTETMLLTVGETHRGGQAADYQTRQDHRWLHCHCLEREKYNQTSVTPAGLAEEMLWLLPCSSRSHRVPKAERSWQCVCGGMESIVLHLVHECLLYTGTTCDSQSYPVNLREEWKKSPDTSRWAGGWGGGGTEACTLLSIITSFASTLDAHTFICCLKPNLWEHRTNILRSTSEHIYEWSRVVDWQTCVGCVVCLWGRCSASPTGLKFVRILLPNPTVIIKLPGAHQAYAFHCM